MSALSLELGSFFDKDFLQIQINMYKERLGSCVRMFYTVGLCKDINLHKPNPTQINVRVFVFQGHWNH